MMAATKSYSYFKFKWRNFIYATAGLLLLLSNIFVLSHIILATDILSRKPAARCACDASRLSKSASPEDAFSNTNNPLFTPQGLEKLISENPYPRLYEPDFTGLQSLCQSTRWQQHVYMSCTENPGGLMNVQNAVLNCIRYAIESGATGLILPKVQIRSSQNLTELRSGDHRRLARTFRRRFDDLLDSLPTSPSEQHPVIFGLDDKMLFSFPPDTDVPTVSQNFGFILEFRRDLSSLAALAVSRLQKILDRSKTEKKYLGLHLRTESDVPKGWSSFRTYGETALSTALDNGISVIYVASGDSEGIEKLRQAVAEYEIAVTSKWRLLTADEQEYLHSFTFDQQAIVDYLVLLQADMFIGSPESSFSSQLVLRRELISGDIAVRDWRYIDETNRLVGKGVFDYADMQWS
ncbi:hypothetical protein TWF696_002301 [Orbilia brochopaga]|uniref:Uncharacterized protein n=1 Tax=Orbilia brochopaga TaxID=3140254 RepID=A0AAV9U4B1_9PEZI